MPNLKPWTLRLALPLLLCAAATAAQAVTILSNLPGTPSGGGTDLGLSPTGTDRTKAVGLTMGAVSMGFESMGALVSNDGAEDSALFGAIYSSIGGNPGLLLATMTSQPVAAGALSSVVTLTLPTPYVLAAGTAYWFVLDGPTTANNLNWNLLSPATVPTANGVTYDGYRFSSSGGATWAISSSANGISISAVPESSTLLMLAAGLDVIGLQLRRR